MRVFVAGATGAIGRPIVEQAVAAGHTVVGMTGRPAGAELLAALGAEPLVADALDAAAVQEAVAKARPEVVIDELTSLPKHYTPEAMKAAAPRDTRLRLEGGAHVLAAARAAGARRYLVPSGCYFYRPGSGLADEKTPFAFEGSPAVAAGARVLGEAEQRALGAAGIEAVVLRYGFFYGPGTWYRRDGDIGEQVRARRLPVVGDGTGVYSFVHIDDAAQATVAAIGRGAPGVYNITDDEPVEMRVWLPAFARYAGAPAPPHVAPSPELDPDFVYYATRLRGAANAKARRELGFRPRPLVWLSGASG